MIRRHWLLSGAAALAVVLVLVTGTLAVRPLLSKDDSSSTDDRSSEAPMTAQRPLWESADLPGYLPAPDSFTLTPLEDVTGEPVTVSLALAPDAVATGGKVGLSFDARELANPIWDHPESNLTLTLQALDRPVLRFGGNGIDRSVWWTSTEEPAPEWAQVTVTPEDLARVARVAEDADAQVTLVLDLGHDDPARAADMAAHAQQVFGERLLAVVIGNEPNGYFHPNQPELAVRDESWGPATYQEALREYSAALQNAAPGLSVAGPGAYDAPWLRAFAESDIPDQRALSMHWYPLWDCEGPETSIANPTVEDLTSPALREQARRILGMGAEIAAEHDLPLWIEETGPTSCPGSNPTSRTHAQALWTSDYVMTAAETGVERLAFHATLQACEGGAPMSPVCATGDVDEPGLIVRGRTSFLALMQLGHLPDGRVLSPVASGDGSVMVHAVAGDDGSLSLVIVDLREPAAAGAVPVEVNAPSGLADDAPSSWELVEGSRLSGTALDAQESALTAPAPIGGTFAGAVLGRAAPLTVTSDPGSVTLLHFAPVPDPSPSDSGR